MAEPPLIANRHAANNRGSTSYATSSVLRVRLRSNSSATARTDGQLSSIRSCAPMYATLSRASNCSTEVEMYSNRSEACKRSNLLRDPRGFGEGRRRRTFRNTASLDQARGDFEAFLIGQTISHRIPICLSQRFGPQS
jgi:hypothetical protein